MPDRSGQHDGAGRRRAAVQVVGAGFFRVSRTPILVGRAVEPSDRLADSQFDDLDAVRAAGAGIVNAAFARQFGALPSIVNRHLAVDGASYLSVRIVGVAADGVTTPGEPPQPTIYFPYARGPMDRFTLLVRATEPPSARRATVARAGDPRRARCESPHARGVCPPRRRRDGGRRAGRPSQCTDEKEGGGHPMSR